MSPRERADSRPTLYMTGNHAIANRRQISLREAIFLEICRQTLSKLYPKICLLGHTLDNCKNKAEQLTGSGKGFVPQHTFLLAGQPHGQRPLSINLNLTHWGNP